MAGLPKFKNELKNIIREKPKAWVGLLKRKYRYILEDIDAVITEYFKDKSISAKAYAYLNDVYEQPICVVCGKKIDVYTACMKTGFVKTCSNKVCRNSYKYIKTKEAVFRKYGVENAFALDIIV